MTITGEQVLAERQRRGMSRRAFAELVGLTQARIHNLEHGRAPRADELEKLLKVMGPGAEESTPQVPGLIHVIRLTNASGNVTRCGLTVGDEFSTAWESEATCPACKNVPIEADDDEPIQLDFEDEDEWSLAIDVTERPPEEIFLPAVRRSSNSEMQTYKRCKRKWWFAWYRHLRLQREMPVGARSIGSWVHEALARYYVPAGQTPESPVVALSQILSNVHSTLEVLLTEKTRQDNDGGFDAERLMSLHMRDADLARAMVEGYIEWIAESGADEGLEMLGSEQYVEADMPFTTPEGTPVKIIGKLDTRIYRRPDDVRFFMDHKTVGNLADPVKTIHMNQQMLHYMYLERQQLDEAPVVGALYNMLRKVKRSDRAQPPFYQRVEVRHNQFELDAYARHLVSTLNDILITEEQLNQGADHHDVAPPTPGRDCAYMCDFLPVCTLMDDGSRADDMISQLYTVGTPYDYYGITQDEKVLDG